THHDGRGPDRVPASRQEIDRQSARSRSRHQVVLAGAAQRAASGSRRHSRRRNARLRNDRDRAHRRGNGPPRALHAAHDGRDRDGQPHHLLFPPHQQKQIRLQLAAVLKAVVSLRLLPRADGLGRVPAAEVLISTAYIRDCIENKEKTKLIKDAIAQGTSQYGMQTFDQSLYTLYKNGLITLDEALRRASNPDEFRLKLQGIQSTADMSREEMESKLAVGDGSSDPFADESPFDFGNTL